MSRTSFSFTSLLVCVGLVGIINAELIPASYGTALHSDATWQQLGVSDILDDGVKWSTDGGTTFGNGEINAGDNVIFKIDMYKDEWGYHDFDALRVWIDFGQDGTFNSSDLITLTNGGVWDFTTTGGATPPNTFRSFYSTAPISFTNEGDYYLRARVTCSQELSQLDAPYDYFGSQYGTRYVEQAPTQADWNAFTATVPLTRRVLTFQTTSWFGSRCSYTRNLPGQGDAEDWKLKVVRHDVPEPTLVSLLGCGLLSLVFVRRKK